MNATPNNATDPLNDLREFPRWWRRLFPELEMLENNGLYAALRVRRLQTKRRMTVTWVVVIAVSTAMAVFLLRILIGNPSPSWSQIGGIVAIVLLGGGIEGFFLWRATIGLPRRTIAICLARNRFRKPAEEMLTVPYSASELVMSLYADFLPSQFGLLVGTLAIMSTIPIMFLFVLPTTGVGSVWIAMIPFMMTIAPSVARRATLTVVEGVAIMMANRIAELAGRQSPRTVGKDIGAAYCLVASLITALGAFTVVELAELLLLADLPALFIPDAMRLPISIAAFGACLLAIAYFCRWGWRRHRSETQNVPDQMHIYEQWYAHAMPIMTRALAGDPIDEAEYQTEILDTWKETQRTKRHNKRNRSGKSRQ
ncbi:hypothetical protein KQI84_08285 [bacterium]|nr:hypothetical protein [bacterium]